MSGPLPEARCSMSFTAAEIDDLLVAVDRADGPDCVRRRVLAMRLRNVQAVMAAGGGV